MCIGPITPPHLTGKEVSIFQIHFATVGLADMLNHRAGLYGVIPY